ncbi:hypothetical protein P7C70_g2278, partial [Phenoliferia sp. Uapishka_3]
MAALHTTPLPTSLDPLSSSFSKLSTETPAAPINLFPASTTTPIVKADEIKKAIFETDYEPSEKLWADDQKAYVKPEDDPLPEGFPEVTEGLHVWEGRELAKKPELWLHNFTAEEIADIDNAITHFLSLDLPFSSISKETFPLTVLKPVLDQAVIDLHRGIGIRVFRGFPVANYDRKSQIIAFAGISSYIGPTRLRQGPSAAIAHLRDLTSLDPGERPAIVVKGQTAGNQVFHTDSGDIIGLFTLDRAAKGGISQLASQGQVYNTFAKERRDILRTLAGKWTNRYDPVPGPLLHHVDGKIIVQYGRRGFFPFFEDQSVPEGIPPITKEQHVALDALHFTAESHALDIDLQPGDLEYANNLLIFHARTSSEDSAEHTRHLLRMWVRNEEFALNHGEALERKWVGLKAAEKETWPLEAWDKAPRQS